MSRKLLLIELAIAIVIALVYLRWLGLPEPLAAIGVAVLITGAHVGLGGLWQRWQPREPVATSTADDALARVTAAIEAIAAGKLETPTETEGPAMQALVTMLVQLQSTREQVHRAALEVASAATEIDASVAMQLRAARQQVDGVTEVSSAIQRLSSSTATISVVTTEQLEHAEQARMQAEVTAGKIAALQQSIEQIGALLEHISEIAARSDLLALNGSLEATHAGEVGRAFALIAAEMRRLAERIGATAADVRQTLAKIASTHADSLRAAHDSREFAERTAQDARRVNELARVQAAESKVVGLSVKEIAEIAERSDAATADTRAAANSLQEQASALERLLRERG
jgi:methyl-accepting chemotaxis protein